MGANSQSESGLDAIDDEVRKWPDSSGTTSYKASMELDHETCYRALRTRDARFDGRFFTAVLSTGVYCRPICPAPTPKRENCLFLASAAAAHQAGFRPCLRCRPEASPGTPAWLGASATVSRALRLISEGALDDGRVEELAQRLGVGARHLRRLFIKHLGAPPLAVAQTRRVLFAKKLIDATKLPMAEVALSSGFSSIRRFNDAIQRAYKETPRGLRRSNKPNGNGGGTSDIALKLPFRPPFHWLAIMRFLAPRAIPGVEAASPDYYRRTVTMDGMQGVVEVRPVEGENHLLAHLRLSSTNVLMQVAERLHRLFDLGADPEVIAAHLGSDPRLGAAVEALPGLRIPGAWDAFELAVRAILGQQISVKAATGLAGRLVEAYGEPLGLDGSPRGTEDLRLVFPRPQTLASADLRTLGLPRTRAVAISSLAAAVVKGHLVLDSSRGLDDTIQKLRELPGVGEWTAQYIAMRSLREPDAFPSTDLGLLRAVKNASGPLTASRLLQAAEPWRPWRAYAAMYLWMTGANAAAAERDSHGTANR